MKFQVYKSATDNVGTPAEVEWEALAEAFKNHDRRAEKDGEAWAPIEVEGTRHDVNVKAITALVADLDHLPEAEAFRIAERLAASGLACIVYSTYSHAPPDNYSLRLVFKLSRSVLPSEWAEFREKAFAHLELPTDPKTKNPSRLYYSPACPPGGPEPIAEVSDGKAIDVDAILAIVSAPAPAPSPSPAPVDLDAARERLRSVTKKESKELARRILDGQSLAPQGDRDNTVNRAASLLATATRLPVEAAEHLVFASILAMPTAPEGVDYWLGKFRYSYERAAARRAENDARRDALNQVVRDVLAPGAKPTGNEWAQALKYRTDKEGNPSILPTASNVGLILEHDEAWAGHVRFNALTLEVEVTGGPCADVPAAVRHISAANWLARSEYALNVPTNIVFEQLHDIARRHPIDPVRDYLESLVWDGTARIDRVLETYFKARVRTDDGRDLTPYVRAASSKFFISAVARTLQPGCKVDSLLILEGPQGSRKSTALAVLGGSWFTDQKINIGDKDSLMIVARFWMIELAELETFRLSEAETKKAFFSQRIDTFRPPYGKVTEDFPRRCVFVGTTNQNDYLTDLTGNRRYWPVQCEGDIDVEGLAAFRDQLWAEAVARYRAGESWWFDEASATIAAQQTEERVVGAAAWQEAIVAWWQSKAESARPKVVTTSEIATGALFLPLDRIDRATEIRIGRIMKTIGFEKSRRRVGGLPKWVFEPSEELRRLPQAIGGTVVQKVTDAKPTGST